MPARSGRAFILILLVLLTVACYCGPAWELVPAYVERAPVEIAGGYSLGRPVLAGLRLYGKEYKCYDDPRETCYPTIVEQSVEKIGWDQSFILVERHPLDTVLFSTPDANNPSWYIVDLSSNRVYDELTLGEFTELNETLGISGIDMKDAMDLYKQER